MNLIQLLHQAGYGAHPDDFVAPDVPTHCVAARTPTETTGEFLADLLGAAFANGMSVQNALDLVRCSAMTAVTDSEVPTTTIIWVGAEWPKGARAAP